MDSTTADNIGADTPCSSASSSAPARLANSRGRILALDVGEVRTGIALSDVARKNATPLQVLDTKQALGNNSVLRHIIEDYEIDTIIVGLPLDEGGGEDGAENQQSRRIRTLTQKLLAGLAPLPQHYVNERLSSKIAQSRGRDLDLSVKDMRGKLDAHAAAAILEGYLDTISD